MPHIDKDGQNVRVYVARKIRRILNHVLAVTEDDTKSLNMLIRIHSLIMFYHGISKSEFDLRWKSFHRVKRALENKLVGSKQHIRALLVDRLVLQHEVRNCHLQCLSLSRVSAV